MGAYVTHLFGNSAGRARTLGSSRRACAGGCTHAPRYRRRRFDAAVRAALCIFAAAAGATAWAQDRPSYLLQPGDQLEISVWGEEDLERQVLVRPDGQISFPLTGEVMAAGRTAGDVQQDIREQLSAYIPEAVVTASVSGIEGNRIYVIGQVNAPGSFVMNPTLSVLQALSLAGGTTTFASLNDIIVVRGSGDDQEVFEFEYGNVSRGRNLQQNIQLQSGDVVIVP